MTNTILTNETENIEYIENLKLDIISEHSPQLKAKIDVKETSAKLESSFVNRGSLTSFTKEIPEQTTTDINNAVLLAQSGAWGAADPTKDPITWWRTFQKVLRATGFVGVDLKWADYKTDSSTVEMDKAILEIVEIGVLGGGTKALITATVDSLRKISKDSDQIKIWGKSTLKGKLGNFQISPVYINESGFIEMVVNAGQFKVSEHRTDFLWMHWKKKETKLKLGRSAYVFNMNQYDKVRYTVESKLGVSGNDFLMGLPLG